MRVRFGTYYNDSGSTGGLINVELDQVIFISFEPNGAGGQTVPANTGFTGGVGTIYTAANQIGRFMAVGL